MRGFVPCCFVTHWKLIWISHFLFAVCHCFPPISPTRLDLRVQGLSEGGVCMRDVNLIPSSWDVRAGSVYSARVYWCARDAQKPPGSRLLLQWSNSASCWLLPLAGRPAGGLERASLGGHPAGGLGTHPWLLPLVVSPCFRTKITSSCGQVSPYWLLSLGCFALLLFQQVFLCCFRAPFLQLSLLWAAEGPWKMSCAFWNDFLISLWQQQYKFSFVLRSLSALARQWLMCFCAGHRTVVLVRKKRKKVEGAKKRMYQHLWTYVSFH